MLRMPRNAKLVSNSACLMTNVEELLKASRELWRALGRSPVRRPAGWELWAEGRAGQFNSQQLTWSSPSHFNRDSHLLFTPWMDYNLKYLPFCRATQFTRTNFHMPLDILATLH